MDPTARVHRHAWQRGGVAGGGARDLIREAAMKVETWLRRCTLALLLIITAPAIAQQPVGDERYPARPVKIIVPYPAGGPGDTIARIFAQKLSERIGGQFYVEDLPGGSSIIGTRAVANAPADGHTILIATQDVIVQAIVKSKVPYDPFKSFVPVIQLVAAPEMIVVHPSLPVQNMNELIALLAANPGKYSYASPGYGSSPHLACEWLFRLTYGLDVTHVPFQGAAPAVLSVISGQTPIFHITLPVVAPYVRDAKLRALAVASTMRSPFLPDVPTLAEVGISGHEVGFWIGALVPAGTPAEVVQRLQREMSTITKLPDVKEQIATLYFNPIAGTSEEFASTSKPSTTNGIRSSARRISRSIEQKSREIVE
jgi:tripartite-type tricarboxylate transporter receptor subunit TctC